jgi:hypothetical protein
MSKYQGFTPMGVLFGFLALVLTLLTALMFDLNKGGAFIVLVFWGLLLFVAPGLWRKLRG